MEAMTNDTDPDSGRSLGAVGDRLRALRTRRDLTLADLSAETGISVSTLSRLESGSRRPTLELLLPLKTAIDGNRQAWLEDPDGNRIELMEMAPDSLQYQAIRRLHAEKAIA